MTIDPRDLRNAFGRFPSGVTVVTALDAEGRPVGFTANSFTSVSLDPPLLLVCPGKHLSSFEVFRDCKRFAVNILAEGQEAISSHFAGFKGDRFEGDHWEYGAEGLPWIKGAAAQFSCAVSACHEAGDHILLVGEVLGYQHKDARGLGYMSGQYFNLGLERAAFALPETASFAGAILEYENAVYFHDGSLPLVSVDTKTRVRETLTAHLESLGIDARLGAAYSLYSTENNTRHYSFFLATLREPPRSRTGFVPIEELNGLEMKDSVQQTMMRRYAREFQYRNFGLYVGDEADGEVHQIEG